MTNVDTELRRHISGLERVLRQAGIQGRVTGGDWGQRDAIPFMRFQWEGVIPDSDQLHALARSVVGEATPRRAFDPDLTIEQVMECLAVERNTRVLMDGPMLVIDYGIGRYEVIFA